MDISDLAQAIFASALNHGAHQVTVDCGENSLRIFELLDTDRILTLEGNPSLGPPLLEHFAGLTEMQHLSRTQVGELTLNGEKPASLVLDEKAAYLHVGQDPEWLRLSTILKLAEDPDLQKCAQAILNSAVTGNFDQMRLERGTERISILQPEQGLWVQAPGEKLPNEFLAPITAYLKTTAGMIVAENSFPQSGRFIVETGDRAAHVLISTNPGRLGFERVRFRVSRI